MTGNELLQSLAGKWQGTCRTWFEPGKLADESAIAGEFIPVLDGRFLRHVYTSSIQGKSRAGEELLAFNNIAETFQVTWIDSFHMNYAILISQGAATDRGFSVLGSYDVGKGLPPWGWRTEFALEDASHLVVTAYNIMPGETEARAIEIDYRRKGG